MAKKVKVSQEELHEQNFQGHLKDELKKNIPTPTRFFEVGEEVQWGHHQHSIITEVHDGGRVYTVVNTNKKPEHYHRSEPFQEITKHPSAWMYIQKKRSIEEIQKIPSFIDSDDRFNYSQRDITGILSSVYFFGVDMNPDYQRDLCWNIADKQELIHSIFNNVDIGKFVLIRHSYTDKFLYEVLDGKQRINALCEFYEDRFSYRGLKFSELCTRDQYHFTNYSISYAETQPLTEEKKLRYFLKLNVSGVPQDPEHLLNIQRRLDELENKNEK